MWHQYPLTHTFVFDNRIYNGIAASMQRDTLYTQDSDDSNHFNVCTYKLLDQYVYEGMTSKIRRNSSTSLESCTFFFYPAKLITEEISSFVCWLIAALSLWLISYAEIYWRRNRGASVVFAPRITRCTRWVNFWQCKYEQDRAIMIAIVTHFYFTYELCKYAGIIEHFIVFFCSMHIGCIT